MMQEPDPLSLAFLLLKIQDHAVDAISQAGGRRAVIKYVSQVCFAPAALYFCTLHAMGIIRQVDDAGL